MVHKYFIKTPWLVKRLFPSYEWSLPSDEHAVYLTFDDGPHPEITPWVLDQLKKYNAKATFFCIGNNVVKHPETYQRILNEGHAVGNHTQDHMNGWKTGNKEYLSNVAEAAQFIHSNLFRPPYGRLKNRQAKKIGKAMQSSNARIIMWDVLSADFDAEFTSSQCLEHVTENTTAGSIIVFHDSEKAMGHLKYILPAALEFLKQHQYAMKKID